MSNKLFLLFVQITLLPHGKSTDTTATNLCFEGTIGCTRGSCAVTSQYTSPYRDSTTASVIFGYQVSWDTERLRGTSALLSECIKACHLDNYFSGQVGGSEAEMSNKLFLLFVQITLLPHGKSTDTTATNLCFEGTIGCTRGSCAVTSQYTSPYRDSTTASVIFGYQVSWDTERLRGTSALLSECIKACHLDNYFSGQVGGSEAEMSNKLFLLFVQITLLPHGKSTDTTATNLCFEGTIGCTRGSCAVTSQYTSPYRDSTTASVIFGYQVSWDTERLRGTSALLSECIKACHLDNYFSGQVGGSEAEMSNKLFLLFVQFSSGAAFGLQPGSSGANLSGPRDSLDMEGIPFIGAPSNPKQKLSQGAPVKAAVWRVTSPRTPSHAGSPAHVWLHLKPRRTEQPPPPLKGPTLSPDEEMYESLPLSEDEQSLPETESLLLVSSEVVR
ncbi:hypothetical protein ISCGN_003926 [Ixodes scapularis]